MPKPQIYGKKRLFDLTEEQDAALVDRAKRDGVKVNVIIRAALDAYLGIKTTVASLTAAPQD